MSKLALQLIAKNKRTKNPYLDLGMCELRELPNELFDCVWLEELVLSDEWIEEERDGKATESMNEGDYNFLSTIPKKIYRLQNLKSLKAGGNFVFEGSISDISFLSNLTGLQKLNISYNEIFDISSLTNLIGLQNLYLCNNKISDISCLTNLTRLQKLDLSYNCISNITPLTFLKKLEYLKLSCNQISDFSSISNLIGLQKLDLRENKISNISFLSNLTGLQKLELSSNLILNISLLSNLTGLQKLDISHNKIYDISSLSNLTGLHELDLNSNQISDISSLSNLTGLQKLSLNFNNISDISSLSNLTGLQKLDLIHNKINNFRPLTNLIRLKELNLSRNPISDFSSLSNLTGLQELNLDSNQISDISFLSNLTGLQKLRLSNNLILNISLLSKLTGLQTIYLDENQISDINSLYLMTELKFLILDNNQISDFKALLSFSGYKSGILKVEAKNNPANPLEIQAVEKGYEALVEYYRTQDVEKVINNDQIKVIVLGNSTAGKTSLVQYWGQKQFNEKQCTTHGIDTPMEIPYHLADSGQTFRAHVWDFGGQDYYHATHRLFITPNSTYILVCNSTLENKSDPEWTTEYICEHEMQEEAKEVQVMVQHYPYRYWLQTLAHLTKIGAIDGTPRKPEGQYAPLFLVENKCGLLTTNDRMTLDKELANTLPFEVIQQDFFHLDIQEAWNYTANHQANSRKAVKYNAAYEEFEEKLIEVLQQEINSPKHSYKVFANYPVIRDILGEMANYLQNTDVPEAINTLLQENKINPIASYQKLPVWISYAEYEDIVRRNSKPGYEPNFEWLHIYLQNMSGRIMHFKDIPELADMVFISPNWLHETIYKVLSLEVLRQKGAFTLQQADEVIDGEILEASLFIKIMQSSDLVFELDKGLAENDGDRTFVAPQYLPMQCPFDDKQLNKKTTVDHKLALTLRFPHFLPPSLISRIISVKGHLYQEYVWRNGIVYEEDDVSMLLICQPVQRTIDVYSNATDDKKKSLLHKFMVMMEEKFSDDINEVMLKLPDLPEEASWNDLLNAKKEKKDAAINKRRGEGGYYINLSHFDFLLPEFEHPPVNIFICYAHEDMEYKQKLCNHLIPALQAIEREHSIKLEIFHDDEMTTGELWRNIIRKRIKDNDILICLLSDAFFASTFIAKEEYGRVMNEIIEGKRDTLIAPLYFQSCLLPKQEVMRNMKIFRPPAMDFKITNAPIDFSFCNLIDEKPNSIANYAKQFAASIAEDVIQAWKRKDGSYRK